MAPARFETGTFILAAKPIWARRLTSLSKFMKGNIFQMKKQLSDPHHVLDAQCKLLPCGIFKQMWSEFLKGFPPVVYQQPISVVLKVWIKYFITNGLEELRFTVRLFTVTYYRKRQRIFPLTSVSRPALRPTQPPVQWVPGVLSPGVKARPGRDADHSPPSSAEVENE
jgi:hypothetical protein